MALPCVDNSCNIKAEINPETRHLLMTALTAPGRALVPCTVDGGLGLNVLGADDPEAAPANTTFMDLGTTPGQPGDTELWAALKNAAAYSFGGGAGANDNIAAPIPHNGQESLTESVNTNPISVNSFTNPFAAPALTLVKGTYRLGFSLEETSVTSGMIANEAYRADPNSAPAILYMPYHAKIRAQILAKIGAEPTNWEAERGTDETPGPAQARSTAFFDISGMARFDRLPQHLRDWRDFLFVLVVPANEQVHLAASASHHGDHTIRTFVDTETPPGINGEMEFHDRGIRASGNIIFLPIGA